MNIILIHGSFGSPSENWFPWFKQKAAQSGIECISPPFPTPEGQTFDNWALLLDGYHDAGRITKGTIVVSHSSGGPFIVKYLISRRLEVAAIITVAGFNNFISGNAAFDDINAEFYLPIDEVGEITRYANIRQCFYSDNDPYLPIAILESFCTSISGAPHIIRGAGHFNNKSGWQQFPAVWELAKACTKRPR